jgi:hypothetical protein
MRERARERRREAWDTLVIAWGTATIPNALEAFGVAPSGWAWTALRAVLSTLFLLALVAWLVALVRERRAREA